MTTRTILILTLLWTAAVTWPVRAQQQAAYDGPVLTADGKLQRPTNYREWVFLTSSYNLVYGPAAATQDTRLPPFNNVFVNPSSYRAFMKTGKWPDRTIFILEIRRASNTGLLDKSRRFQTEVTAIEATVKDARRRRGAARRRRSALEHLQERLLRMSYAAWGGREDVRAVLSGTLRRREAAGNGQHVVRPVARVLIGLPHSGYLEIVLTL